MAPTNLPANFRDIVEVAGSGGMCGKDGRRVRAGRLFRSSNPEASDKNTTEFFAHALNVTRVVDLRDTPRPTIPEEGPFENVYIKRRFEEQKFRVDQYDWVHIKFYTAYQNVLSDRLSVGDKVRLGWCGVGGAFSGDGEPMQNLLNRRMIGSLGVVKYYEEMVDYCVDGVVDALVEITNALSEKKQGAVIIHCEFGLDRTGILVAIIMMLLGVDEKDIVHDFSESEDRLNIEDVRKSKPGLSDDFCMAPPRAILGAIRYITDMHRGVERYLQRKGFDEDLQHSLREALLD
eukprot:CFRG1022T1